MLDRAAIHRDWFSNIRADVLAGLVVALALIPEAIGFSIIAGVDPRVGLYASVAIAMVIASMEAFALDCNTSAITSRFSLCTACASWSGRAARATQPATC